MKSAVLYLLPLLLICAGCQCAPCTEHYCDVIDDIADSGPRCDHLYHAKLDLTRLGRSDGPGCCRMRCCR